MQELIWKPANLRCCAWSCYFVSVSNGCCRLPCLLVQLCSCRFAFWTYGEWLAGETWNLTKVMGVAYVIVVDGV